MALFNLGNMKKFYTVLAKCVNCGHIFELKIPKGVTTQEYASNGLAKCENCGCAELRVKANPTPVKKQSKPLPAAQPW